MEKAAFRADGEQWSVDSVLDVVRGSLRFDTMRAFTRCLHIVGEYEGVVIRRLKDRFSNPTDSGWRDCLLNISFADDPDKCVASNDAFPRVLAHERALSRRTQQLTHIAHPPTPSPPTPTHSLARCCAAT